MAVKNPFMTIHTGLSHRILPLIHRKNLNGLEISTVEILTLRYAKYMAGSVQIKDTAGIRGHCIVCTQD